MDNAFTILVLVVGQAALTTSTIRHGGNSTVVSTGVLRRGRRCCWPFTFGGALPASACKTIGALPIGITRRWCGAAPARGHRLEPVDVVPASVSSHSSGSGWGRSCRRVFEAILSVRVSGNYTSEGDLLTLKAAVLSPLAGDSAGSP